MRLLKIIISKLLAKPQNLTTFRGILASKHGAKRLLVAHTGFEPVTSALRGRRPKPLDECAFLQLRVFARKAFQRAGALLNYCPSQIESQGHLPAPGKIFLHLPDDGRHTGLPPTRITSSTSAAFSPASARAWRQGSSVSSMRSATSCSSLALGRVMLRCLGPHCTFLAVTGRCRVPS